jgi:hypothetical protein
MKKKLLFLTAIIIYVAFLSSCKKDKDEETPKTIVGKWKQISGRYSPAYFNETDYFSSSASCEKDDIIEFKSGDIFEYSEGVTKCDASDPQVFLTGTYSINSDMTSITFNGETSAIELTTSTLKVTHPFSEAGVNYSDIMIFQRQ